MEAVRRLSDTGVSPDAVWASLFGKLGTDIMERVTSD